MKYLNWFVTACLLSVALPAHADKLIWIPTADVDGIRGEYMSGTNSEGNVITAQLGLGRYFELLGRRYRQDDREQTEIGGQFQVLPEGLVTPGLAFGAWDVADKTPRGRRVFGVVSKKVPGVNFLPTVVRELRLHAGVGTGELSTIFGGARVGLPLGLALVLEGNSQGFNAGLWWSPHRVVRLKAESWDGDFFLGAQLTAPL